MFIKDKENKSIFLKLHRKFQVCIWELGFVQDAIIDALSGRQASIAYTQTPAFLHVHPSVRGCCAPLKPAGFHLFFEL